MTGTIQRPALSTAPELIGLIGVGLMGSAIAGRLQGARHKVLSWDIAPNHTAAWSRSGGTSANNAAEVFERCDRVLFSLPDLNVVADVLGKAISFLRRGQIIVDTTTGAPDQAVELARQLEARDVIYLDATISGNSAQVGAAEVTVMVGGPKAAVERCQDLFLCFARKAIHTGPSGSGAKMKLVTNLVLGLNRAALAEGFVLARALGLDGEQTLDVLRETAAYSRIMDAKGEKMLRGDFEPQARLSQHLKDVRLMLAAAAKADTKLPLSETHRRLLELAESLDLGHLDNSVVIRAIEGWKGS